MRDSTQRLLARWLHLVLGIPIIGYVYSPFENLPQYAPLVRYVFLPLILGSGLWMWKGHVVRRWLTRGAAGG